MTLNLTIGTNAYVRIRKDNVDMQVLLDPDLTVRNSLIASSVELREKAARLIRTANLILEASTIIDEEK